MEAASALRRARADAGLSQRALARRADVPQPAIARIEQGRVTPRVDTLAHLLAACGRELTLTAHPGQGIDRSVIRQLLRLTPRERLDLAVTEATNLDRLIRKIKR
jgi:transcriptional regulator with XRE-family HTH domain